MSWSQSPLIPYNFATPPLDLLLSTSWPFLATFLHKVSYFTFLHFAFPQITFCPFLSAILDLKLFVFHNFFFASNPFILFHSNFKGTLLLFTIYFKVFLTSLTPTLVNAKWFYCKSDVTWAARPRTKELYARKLILFLGKEILQTPRVNTENFSKLFYIPLVKSSNDVLHLHALLFEETSNTSNNKLKMPVSRYDIRDSPGHGWYP